jgi:hypothetical protein
MDSANTEVIEKDWESVDDGQYNGNEEEYRQQENVG